MPEQNADYVCPRAACEVGGQRRDRCSVHGVLLVKDHRTLAERQEQLRTAYEVCSSCKGSGLQNGMHGPVTCWTCHGDNTVRIRDEHGRFTTAPAHIDSSGGAE